MIDDGLARLNRSAWLLRIACALALLTLAAASARAGERQWYPVTDNGIDTNGAQHVAVFQGKLWALSYLSASGTYDAVCSTDGAHWTTKAHFTNIPKDGFQTASLVVFNNKLWIFNEPASNSYSSADGIHWTRIKYTGDTGMFLVQGNALWMLKYWAEVWRSENGTDWKLINNADFHAYIDGFVYFSGKFWIILCDPIGGESPYVIDRVYSSPDAIHWTEQKSPPWVARDYITAVVFENRLWLLGGSNVISFGINDVWSTSDGIHWDQVNAQAPWAGRWSISTVVYQNRLWGISGQVGEHPFKDAWLLDPQVPGKPVIRPIAPMTASEGTTFTGPPLRLIQGTFPVTWTKLQGPATMTIDTTTGALRWPTPVDSGAPRTIRVRAANSLGSDETTFTLTVEPYRPVLSVPPFSKGLTCAVSWSAIPGVNGYILQRAATADFKTPLQTLTFPNPAIQKYSLTFPPGNDGRTYWYRVRGIRRDGIADAWSGVVSSMQDATPPTGTVKINDGSALARATAATLTLSASDPGTKPSGVSQMRLSLNSATWLDWEPYVTTRSLWLDTTRASQAVAVQFMDRAGNISAAAIASTTLAPLPVCVDAATTGTADGTPAHPYPTIQQAIDAAKAPADIYIAGGDYPESINLKSGLALFGGFPRGNFTLAARRRLGYPVQITGASDDIVTLDSVRNVWLDGLTAGYRYIGPTYRYGGYTCFYGMNLDQSVKITNCGIYDLEVLDDNEIDGIYLNQASPLIQDCTIQFIQACQGSGIDCESKSNPLIDRCLIANMEFYRYYYDYLGEQVYSNGYGCGIQVYESFPKIQNCIISDIWAQDFAYGIDANENPSVLNCTIAKAGTGVYASSAATLRNCILWGNSSNLDVDGTLVPAYCCIQGWTGGGTGNIAATPHFVNYAASDFRLSANSPCIDAAGAAPTVKTDFAGNPRPHISKTTPAGDGSHMDIGAYEFQQPATP